MAKSTTKNKKLTVANVKKDHEVLSKRYTVTIKGQTEDYDLDIDHWFTKTKKTSLISELQKQVQAMRLQNVNLAEGFLAYIYLLIIKYFTSLNIPNDYEKQIAILEYMTNTDIFKQIVDNLPQQEVEELMNDIIQLSNNIEEARLGVINKLADEGLIVENEEVMNLLKE